MRGEDRDARELGLVQAAGPALGDLAKVFVDLLRTVGRHVPPPPGVASPAAWGNPDHLASLFRGVKSLRMVRRDFVPGGRATLQLKDVRLMSQLADSVGLDSPTLKNSLAQWEKFVHEKGFGDLDHSGLFRLYE